MGEALEEMTEKDNLGMTLIVSAEGRLQGILTDGDLGRALLLGQEAEQNFGSRPVADFMTREPHIVDPGASAADAIRSRYATLPEFS